MPRLRIRAGLTAAAVMLAFAGAPLAAQPTDDDRAFAEQAMVEIAAALPDAAISMAPGDPLQINIKRATEAESGEINLHRLRGFCRTISAADCAAEQTRLINVLVNAASRRAPKAGDLRIIVRDTQYWDYVARTLGKDGDLPLHRRIGDDLYAILALDSPEAIQVAQREAVADLGLEPDEAWTQAVDQTRLVVPALSTNERIAENLFVFEGNEYTGSMLANGDSWAVLAARNGPDLAVIVSSDQLVIAGIVPSGPDLAQFESLAREQCDIAPRCISPHVYRWQGGMWVIAR